LGEHAALAHEGAAGTIIDIGPIARQRMETEILARSEALPSPPDILAILQRRAGDQEAPIGEIEGLLRQDPALVARLLRLVNSSFFALRHKVNNIGHAVALVGFRTLRSLIFAAFADEVFRNEMPVYGYARRGLWRHAVRCAFTARLLALRGVLDRSEAEDLFIAGLLHDLGKLLLWPTLRHCAEEFDQAMRASDGNLVASERAVCGMDHAAAGALVARRWNLAESLVETIAHHHDPTQAPLHPALVSAVHLVNWVLSELRVGLLPRWSYGPRLVPAALELLHLDAAAIDDLKCWLAQTGGRDAIDD
jgi:HD-like signal output (HDOD) protein